ncbi:MAG: hypothetical protein FJZ56_02185 [Chlamydiae bacterium]|nr:hypothetical protein [Chlamydiota bacterium]
MKWFYGFVFTMTVLAQLLPSKCYSANSRKVKSHSSEFTIFFQEIGCPLQGKSDNEIQEFLPYWIANKQNQDLFLSKLSEHIENKGNHISEETLSHLKDSLRLWYSTIKSDKSVRFERKNLLTLPNMALGCEKNTRSSSEQDDSIDEYLESMRKESDELKSEARDTVLRAIGEAVSAGASFAALQPEVAIIPGYFACKDFVEACEIYNQAIELDRKIEELEEPLDEEKPTKIWWKFWE